MKNLVGSPADGIQFNLFDIVDRNEEVLLAVGDDMNKSLMPRLEKAEKMSMDASKSAKLLHESVGGDVLKKLAAVENSVRQMKFTADAGDGPTFGQVRTVILEEIIPAMTDLWDLYMIATEGPGKTVKPGSGQAPGKYLLTQLEAGGRTVSAPPCQREQGDFGAEDRAARTGFGAWPGCRSTSYPVDLRGKTVATAPPAEAVAHHGLGAAPQGVDGLAMAVSGLEAKVKELDSQVRNTTVTCGSFTFRSVEECETFILEYVPGNTYAHFYDMVSLLQRAGETPISVSDVWEKLYNMKRAGFTCKGEAIIYVSMTTILPTCLGELTGKLSKSTCSLPGLHTHGHWTSKGSQLGRRRDIAHCLANVKPTLENQQRNYFSGNWMGGRCRKNSSPSCMRTGPTSRP
jgi:hypothetical protein